MQSGRSGSKGTQEQVQNSSSKDRSPKETPTDPNDVNAKTLTQLNTLMEESLQIYELEDQKTNVIDDLNNALLVITEFLGFSTTIHPKIFNLPEDTTVTLMPNLKLIIKLSNGKTETKKFTDYNPETITEIIEYVTPQLLELIETKIISDRKDYFLENCYKTIKHIKPTKRKSTNPSNSR